MRDHHIRSASLVLAGASLAGALSMTTPIARAADPFWETGKSDTAHAITVYRSASCGCCKGWIAHLRDHRFDVEEVLLDDLTDVKRRHGVAPQLASCHTAVADGHVFEGHVPANDIKAVLETDDTVRLLAVPGMPSGTPGMDFPGAPKDAFAVIAVNGSGAPSVYRRYSQY